MICNGTGIFSIGNKKPLNNSVGKNKLIMEVNMAVCCVFALLEINMPKESEVMVNKILSAINNHKLPTIGTSST